MPFEAACGGAGCSVVDCSRELGGTGSEDGGIDRC